MEWVGKLVRQSVVQRWETQDTPEHLKTIRNRIQLSDEQRTGRLLGIYQQVLQQGNVAVDASPEQMELRLTGLVVKHNERLYAYNQIYQEVFNQDWVEQELAKLRPSSYREMFAAWERSEFTDESRLLRGQALVEAQTWATGKSLSDRDYQFLKASVDQERQVEREEAEILSQAYETLSQAKLKADRKIKTANRAKVIAFVLLIFTVVWLSIAVFNGKLINLMAQSKDAEAELVSNRPFDALLGALQTGQELHQIRPLLWGQDTSQAQISGTLLNTVYSVVQRNRLTNKYPLSRLGISPDGKTIATGSTGGAIEVHSSDGKFRKELGVRHNNTTINSIQFSPTTPVFATAADDGMIQIWKQTGEPVDAFNQQKKEHEGAIYSLSFSPDGQMIASGGEDKRIKLWSSEGGLIRDIPEMRHTAFIIYLSFSPDGTRLVSADDGNIVKVWNVVDGSLVTTIPLGDTSISSISVSPDGRWVASGNPDASITLWNVQQGSKVNLTGHLGPITRLAFSPDSQTLASASQDKTVKLWSLDGRLLLNLMGHQNIVNDVSYSVDGKMLASVAEDAQLILWDVDGRLLKTLAGHRDIALRVNVRTFLKCRIYTITKAIEFIPPLSHPVFNHTPPMFDIVQIWTIRRQIPQLTFCCCHNFLNVRRVMKTCIVNDDRISCLQFWQQTILQPHLK